jgi:hypothetical protein
MGYFFHGKTCVLIFARNVLGYILGDFFTNASGHPASKVAVTDEYIKTSLRASPTHGPKLVLDK